MCSIPFCERYTNAPLPEIPRVYIYGKSDHRPLESILKKPIGKASPRLQQMMLQLQRYTLNVRCVPGKLMYVADTLSRAYITGDAGLELPRTCKCLYTV